MLIACGLALTIGHSAAGTAADDFSVEAEGQGPGVSVQARARIRAPWSVIWETLTDYEHLPQFVPGMRTSRVIQRRGASAVVEQKGHAGFLVFNYPIDVVVESVEVPPGVIEIHVLRGNVKQLDGRYVIERDPLDAEGHVLHWHGVIEPALALPSFISAPLVRASIRDQFLGMVREIERRNARRIAAAANAK
jgi:hypothetical protein